MVILPYISSKTYDIFIFSQKIQRRLSSLKAMPWSVEKKKEIEKAVGSMDYTSSDESDWSEDENGESRHSGFLVKKLFGIYSAAIYFKTDIYLKTTDNVKILQMMAKDYQGCPP